MHMTISGVMQNLLVTSKMSHSSFKGLVIMPGVHLPKPSRWLRENGKKNPVWKNSSTTGTQQDFLITAFTLHMALLPIVSLRFMYEGVIPEMKYFFLIQFKWLVGTKCSFYSIACFYFSLPPAVKA